ncbi:hypothetical protein GCM10023172_02400 [Hymenobacter ginsengisoli]|uniref:GOLD domain-containing protein n=1 Tax=Hymenobacter ginsengisoli TaxID=1051626 RepID=A0ABP8PWJ6_9BACT|nr:MULTISPECIES: hypothetical protein [unclassified Hymenobacter]MBO2030343.1 hypothetical protein [Hymenobacter sp. BT559]
MKYYLLAFVALSATSCLNVGPDSCNTTLLTPVTSVSGPKTIAVNQTATYSLSYLPAGGCGTLANLTEQNSGNTRAISVNVNYTNCSCPTAAVPGQTTYTFQPTQAGTYYLKFVGINTYIVDTLVAQ